MHSNLESILSHVVSDPTLHARWLNTFSYLEFTGCRKIIKSQKSDFITSETLKHAVEEGRHALLLKKLAIKFGGASFDSYSSETMLCPDQAARYFHDLDQACDLALSQIRVDLKQARFVYLCLTWLVEVRALSVYRLYQRITDTAGFKLPLLGLLSEEDRHLKSAEAELQDAIPNFEEQVRELRALENRLYDEYLTAVFRELTLESEATAIYD